MKKLRMGVIGCGDITKYMLFFARWTRNIQVVGCADINIEKARRYAKFFKGAKAFEDYVDMIHDTDPDAVYLAVPHHLHYPMMEVLIEHGIHILCEKPITINLKDAIEIAELAKSKDVKVGVNYQYRYDKACYRMAMAAQNGDLGELYYGTCNIPWYRDCGYFNTSKWHGRREQAGGGTLLTQGSHALDILLWSFGAKPVYAMGVTKNTKFTAVEVEDLAMGIIELANGGVIQITSSMVATPEQPVTISLYGSKGTAMYTGPNFPRIKFKNAKIPKYRLKVKGLHALSRSLEAFTRWVLWDAPYHNPAENAIPVLASILTVYRSAKTNQTEKVMLP